MFGAPSFTAQVHLRERAWLVARPEAVGMGCSGCSHCSRPKRGADGIALGADIAFKSQSPVIFLCQLGPTT